MEYNTLASSMCSGHVTGTPGLIFTNFISTMMAAQCAIGNPNIYPADANEFVNNEYDFIVVGSGSAGSVVANRLSEVKDWNVLLLEAGGDPSLTSEIPLMFFHTVSSETDWKYKTEKMETSCRGFQDGKCYWPRGKSLGGSSSMNAMMYVRGHKKDYDAWEQLGNSGWNYENVLKYFKKSEDYVDDSSESKYHGKGGLLTVGHSKFKNPLSDILIEAAEEQGYKIVDVNGECQSGFSKAPFTIRSGTRCSTAKAFLASAKGRRNLHVAKFSHVSKILIDQKTKRAYGIEFIGRNGEKTQVRASKEVIVSGGAINSPQILMLSGIGPKKHLKEMGISVIKDLKVGEHLQDHAMFPGLLFTLAEPEAMKLTQAAALDFTYEYLKTRSGPFSTVGITEVTGFVDTKSPADSSDEYPDIQFVCFYFHANETLHLEHFIKALRFGTEYANRLRELTSSGGVMMLVPVLLRPKSIGKLLLRTVDPFEHPKIFHNYFAEQDDLDTLVRGIKAGKALGISKIMKSMFDSKLADFYYEECKEFEFDTDNYWKCALKQVGSTLFHPTGTCKMGPSGDKSAVVDPSLKVHGIKGLRVADASIMPDIVSGNTNAPSIMIGEMASDLIKKDWIKP